MSMIPGSLFQQNFSILKALFSDYYEELAAANTPDAAASSSDRAGSVGLLGMAAGLAFMAGPLTGATVLKTYEQATWAAMVCTIISGLLILQLPTASKPLSISQPSHLRLEFGSFSMFQQPDLRLQFSS